MSQDTEEFGNVPASAVYRDADDGVKSERRPVRVVVVIEPEADRNTTVGQDKQVSQPGSPAPVSCPLLSKEAQPDNHQAAHHDIRNNKRVI
jgi:hypothetical protein